MRIKLLVMCVAIAACLANSSLAGFSFKASSGGAFSSSFVLPANGGSVSLFLVEDITGAPAFNAGAASYQLVRTAVVGSPTVGVTTGAPWPLSGVDTALAPLTFTVQNSTFGTPITSSLFNGLQSLQVGVVNFTGPGTSATYSFRDIDGGSQVLVSNATGSIQAIDAAVFAASTPFTITAVPEPSSMALLGLVGVGAAAVRRFRKKNKA